MAAAYAALQSLRHTIEYLQNHSITSLDQTQIPPLSQNLTSLLHLLESRSWVNSAEADALEERIAAAANEADDLIESHIVNRTSSVNFLRFLFKGTVLVKVTKDMDLFTNAVREMTNEFVDAEPLRNNHTRSLPNTNFMVGVDDMLDQVKNKVTNNSLPRARQFIPIVGMGGSGKTALARCVYDDPLIVHQFGIRIWVTISRKYSVREILLQSLLCLSQNLSDEYPSGMSEFELGNLLRNSLYGRTYFVVMDDLWDVDAWNKMQGYFPDCCNGSRIVMTTRLTNVALKMADSFDVVKMKLLEEDDSWNLFRRIVFSEQGCHPQFEETGKRIMECCKGLPLSIKVISGLLSKHKQSLTYWKYVLKNFKTVLNSRDGERCSQILRLSYMELPIHLKPCFLYMGVFREDSLIPKSRLVRLLVAEGFLKPISGKSLEIVAEEYLQDLVDRNLFMVEQLGSTGNIKYFKIHDLLRDLCIEVSRKNKFLYLIEAQVYFYFAFTSQRRTGLQSSVIGDHIINSLQSSSLRSLICDLRKGCIALKLHEYKSLRVLTVVNAPHVIPQENDSMGIIPSLRLIDIDRDKFSHAPSIVHLWSLPRRHVIIDIWKMPRLRHVKCSGLLLPVPLMEENNPLVVLNNLETLKGVRNVKWTENVVKRIPNVKKLAAEYSELSQGGDKCYCLDRLSQLHKLESLVIYFTGRPSEATSLIGSVRRMRPKALGWDLLVSFSIRKLSLWCMESDWVTIGTKIGSLPHLQVLKLIYCHLGVSWESVEGQFKKLKYLHIGCQDLKEWRVEAMHFTRLEHLVLDTLSNLEEIPREVGDIATLKSMVVRDCTESAMASAKEIEKEQEDLGNEELRVTVVSGEYHNFHKEFSDERLKEILKAATERTVRKVLDYIGRAVTPAMRAWNLYHRGSF